MRKNGFILPFSIISALVILTSLGFWYRQTVMQGFLAKRLVQQRGAYIECRSLMPMLRERLDLVSAETLGNSENAFMLVDVNHQHRWRIDRSAWKNEKIRFRFHRAGQNDEPIELIIPYRR